MSVTMNATMTSAQEVYFGPGGSGTFVKVGSVSSGERVRVNWKENSYYNITYIVNSTGKYKTGYVYAGYVNCDGSVDNRTTDIYTYMQNAFTCNSQVYAFYRCVGDSGECIGYISPGDTCRLVWTAGTDNYDLPYWKYVQYPVDGTSKYKRGWIYT